MSTIYGIPACDTMRKARAWLDAESIAHRFHDWRRDGIDPVLLVRWIQAIGWEALLNRAGTTFRKLPEGDKVDLDAARATAIMVAHPAAIRRPVVDRCGSLLVGFAPARYAAFFHVGE